MTYIVNCETSIFFKITQNILELMIKEQKPIL